MDTIIMTIKPYHLRNIRKGLKRGELRKTFPRFCTFPFRVLLCESGSGGQIKAEFTCKSAIPLEASSKYYEELLCLSENEILEYLDGKTGFVFFIKDVIDYCNTKGKRIRNISEFGLKRAPQSWQYVRR